MPLVGSLTGSSLLKESVLAASPLLDANSAIPSSVLVPNSSIIGVNNNNNINNHNHHEESAIGGINNNNKNSNISSNNGEAAALKCPHCLKGFSGFEALKEHVHSNHPERTNNGFGFSCVQCNATFTNRDRSFFRRLLRKKKTELFFLLIYAYAQFYDTYKGVIFTLVDITTLAQLIYDDRTL